MLINVFSVDRDRYPQTQLNARVFVRMKHTEDSKLVIQRLRIDDS